MAEAKTPWIVEIREDTGAREDYWPRATYIVNMTVSEAASLSRVAISDGPYAYFLEVKQENKLALPDGADIETFFRGELEKLRDGTYDDEE